jgi:hypothetical protein
MEKTMNKYVLIAASILVLTVAAGCGDDYDNGEYADNGYAVVAPDYDVYYDGFYGPYPGGYWGDDGYFYYSDDHGGYLRDDGHHFRHERFEGARRFVSQHHGDRNAPPPDDH